MADSLAAMEARVNRLSNAAAASQAEASAIEAEADEHRAATAAARAAAATEDAAGAAAAAAAAGGATAETGERSASSQALYEALEALENDMRQGLDAGPEAADAGGRSPRRSQTMQDVEALALEARSFVRGVSSQLERLQGNVMEKVKLEASVALSIADFVVRRAILDGSRALAAAASSTALALGAAPPASPVANATVEAREGAMPFTARKEKIGQTRAQTRQLSLAPASEEAAALEGARLADEERSEAEAALWEQQAAAQREGAAEAAELAKELLMVAADAAIQGAERVLTEIASQSNGTQGAAVLGSLANASASLRVAEGALPEASAMLERARKVGSTLQDATNAALDSTRADYQSYLELRSSGQLPTLAEEAEGVAQSLVPEALAQLPQAARLLPGAPAGGVLGSLQGGSNPTDQLLRLRQRKELELATKQLKLAATLGDRAAKDSGDAVVYGVLPAVTAVGKVAARRLAEQVPAPLAQTLGLPSAAERPSKLGLPGGRPVDGAQGGAGTRVDLPTLVRDVAQQLAIEYTSSSQRGVQAGILPDLSEVAAGPTRLMEQGRSSLLQGGGLRELLPRAKPAGPEASPPPLEASDTAAAAAAAERPSGVASPMSSRAAAEPRSSARAAPAAGTAAPARSTSASVSAETVRELFDEVSGAMAGGREVPEAEAAAVIDTWVELVSEVAEAGSDGEIDTWVEIVRGRRSGERWRGERRRRRGGDRRLHPRPPDSRQRRLPPRRRRLQPRRRGGVGGDRRL